MCNAQQVADLKAIPYLPNYKNWVAWKLTPVNGKMEKVPYVAGFKYGASTNKKEDWSDLETVLSGLEKLDRSQGVGFVFGEDALRGDLVSFDIDGCINPDTDEVAEWAERLLDLLDSYTERTPSGMGLRVWLRGKYTGTKSKWELDIAAGWGSKVEIQIFHKNGYVTVTGNSFYDDVPKIEERDLSSAVELLKEIQAQYPRRKDSKKEAAENPQTISSFTFKPSAPLAALMNGTNSGSESKPFVISYEGQSYEFPSGSEADFKLCELLARKYDEKSLREDKELVFAEIDDQFRKSTLCARNGKWESNSSRRTHTINKAIDGQLEYIVANDSERESTILVDGVFINGPQRGRDVNGVLPALVVTPITDWRSLLRTEELQKTQKSWIEANVPRAFELPMEEEKWLIYKMLLEHCLHLFSGKKGSEKSLLLLMQLRSLATATDLLGRKNGTKPLTVIYVDRENPKAEMIKRMKALGLFDLPNFHIWGDWSVHNPPPASFDDPRFIEQVLRNPLTFFGFDSLSSFLNGADENKTSEMAPIMYSARHLARQCAGVSLVHHEAKQGSAGSRGAGVIGDQTDMAFVIKKSGEMVTISEERFRACETWAMKFSMDWGGLTGIYTPHLISDTLSTTSFVKDEAESEEIKKRIAEAQEEATRLVHQERARAVIDEAYQKALKGEGDCISSQKQLATLIGLNPSGKVARTLLNGGQNNPWECVQGNRTPIVYLPKGVKEIPPKGGAPKVEAEAMFAGGKSVAEVVEALGVPNGTVKTWRRQWGQEHEKESE